MRLKEEKGSKIHKMNTFHHLPLIPSLPIRPPLSPMVPPLNTLPHIFTPVFSEFFDFVPNYPLLTPSWVELGDLRWCQQGDSLRGSEELHLKGEKER